MHPSLPAEVLRLLQAGHRLLAQGQATQAQGLLEQALPLAPNFAEGHRLAGIAALMCGRHDNAIVHLRRALALQPNDAGIHMTLGSALVESGHNEEGLKHLQCTCELQPEQADAWRNLGLAMREADRLDEARTALHQAVTLQPDAIQYRNELALVVFNLGDMTAARTLLRETLGRQDNDAYAWYLLGNLKGPVFTPHDVSHLQALLQERSLSDTARVQLGFTLVKALEDQSDYTQAFAALQESNRCQRRMVHWNREQEASRVQSIAKAFAAPPPAPLDPTLGQEVIFITSMPRAASTLTEQILAAHPDVRGGEETDALFAVLEAESTRRGQAFPHWVATTDAADWQRLGLEYLARTRTVRGAARRFTDKNTNNWAYIGAIGAMLPGARIIQSRRDPIETCLANYRQLFTSADFSYDLDELVAYYAGYVRLSAQWQALFPERCLESHYETLQAHFEGQVHRLLDFCGLAFDPACLKFHQAKRAVRTLSGAQVREPIRKDTARAPLYGAMLNPLRAKLQAAGIDCPAVD